MMVFPSGPPEDQRHIKHGSDGYVMGPLQLREQAIRDAQLSVEAHQSYEAIRNFRTTSAFAGLDDTRRYQIDRALTAHGFEDPALWLDNINSVGLSPDDLKQIEEMFRRQSEYTVKRLDQLERRTEVIGRRVAEDLTLQRQEQARDVREHVYSGRSTALTVLGGLGGLIWSVGNDLNSDSVRTAGLTLTTASLAGLGMTYVQAYRRQEVDEFVQGLREVPSRMAEALKLRKRPVEFEYLGPAKSDSPFEVVSAGGKRKKGLLGGDPSHVFQIIDFGGVFTSGDRKKGR